MERGLVRLEEFFHIGMDRRVFAPNDPRGPQINLGHGNKQMPDGVVSIGLPEWDAEIDPIPFDTESIGTIWALHFLEHIENVLWVLRECHRVLRPGGAMNIVVPYGACHMYVHDLTHRHMFNEDTWRQTFHNAYYDDKGTDWYWEVSFNMIMGIKGENLALFTQLIKGGDIDE
jgi:predicted SAM-dependent methyltransferase